MRKIPAIFWIALFCICACHPQKKPDGSEHASEKYTAHRPWGMLGAKIYTITEGQKIKTITPGGAAQKAGMQPGDTITSINGLNPGNSREFIRYVRSLLPGTVCTITVIRDLLNTLRLQATIQTYPQDRQLLLMGKLALRALDYQRANDLFKKLISLYPRSPLEKEARTLLKKMKFRTIPGS